MKFNGMAGLSGYARRRGNGVIELQIGPMAYTMFPDEALQLANALADAVEQRQEKTL